MIYGTHASIHINGSHYLREASLFQELHKALRERFNLDETATPFPDWRQYTMNLQEFDDLLEEVCENLHASAWNDVLDILGKHGHVKIEPYKKNDG